MHRLNAWPITFPERQKSNKWYKNSLLCFLYICTCKPLVVVKGEAQWACCCTAVCVCQTWAGGSKRLRPNISDVVSDFIHSRWREKRWGRKTEHRGEGMWAKKGLNKFSLPQTQRAAWPHHRLTLIRARPASYIPPAHFLHW